jgi:nucleoside-diphosphate-sugar epimerase
MRILITGGSGYLGSITAIELAAAGHEVACFDVHGKPAGWEFWQPEEGKVEFIVGDVRNLDDVVRAAASADAVVHMAAIVGGPACARRPEEAADVALRGAENVLRAARGKILVFASSDAVYGNGATGVCDEDFPCRPETLYGSLKLRCEEIFLGNQGYIILRLPSNFGPSPVMRTDLLVHHIAATLVHRGELQLRDPGVIRTLVHVRDSAACVRHAIEHYDRAADRIFNVATCALTKGEIAETIAAVFGGRVRIASESGGRDPDQRNFVLDCSRIRSIGFEPRFDLNNAVRRLHEFLKSTLGTIP